MRKILLSVLGILLILASCNDQESEISPDILDDSFYFPPVGSDSWETTSPVSLNWNDTELNNLYSFLENEDTRAFIVLKNGKIVIEKYFGEKLRGGTFDKNSYWYWASAGKTLNAILTGIAQEEGFLNIEEATSNYLGKGWTSLDEADEDKITILNQLTMTSGLDDFVENSDCTEAPCLQYKTEANERWAYHNAPYSLLENVIATASNKSFDAYFNDKIAQPIGMNGFWLESGYNNVFYSDARSMARYGLLILNEGNWDEIPIIRDKDYFQAMVNTSQSINKSYGYLWWLNGKESFMLPVLQNVFNSEICPNAPVDMFAGVGKNGQFVCVVPSQDLVMVRMGDFSDQNQLTPLSLLNDIWGELNKVIVDK